MAALRKVKQLKLPFLADLDPWYFERLARDRGFKHIAGVDEAGRGPLAGPVVAAAVILPYGKAIEGIDDSKRLTAKRRLELYEKIRDRALAVGVGMATSEEIDRINILQATFAAMMRAIRQLPIEPDHILIDGTHQIPGLSISQEAIPKGDHLSVSIGAASIVAKVKRDNLMERYHREFPVYNFKSNKGYGTLEHRSAIKKYGCCAIHRKTFKGVKEFLHRGSSDEKEMEL